MNVLYPDTKREIGTLDRKLVVESVVVGILVVIVGLIVHALVNKLKPEMVDDSCRDWNKNHIMEICLFLTGALTHLACEFGGVNQWYVNQYKHC